MYSITATADRIAVTSPFHMKDKLKAIPGAKWDKDARQWTYPATPLAAKALDIRLPVSFQRNDAFRALIGEQEQEYVRQQVKSAADLPEIPVTKRAAWNHQKQAFWFAKERPATMLAMDMGTGKSKVTIDLIQNSEDRLVLIVCPKSVVAVWPREIAKHAANPDDWHVVILNTGSTVKNRDAAFRGMNIAWAREQRCIIIVNYEAVWREQLAKFLEAQTWDRIICDESHRIKAPQGVAAKFMAKLARKAKRRLALTGTPMAHSPLDIFSQYRFLDTSVFGANWTSFKNMYADWGGFGGHQLLGYRNERELNERFYQYAYRVGKEVLDLPAALHIDRECVLEPQARKMYDDMRDDFIMWLSDGSEVTATNALAKMLRLQQITSGVAPAEDGGVVRVSTAKADLLEDILEDIAPLEPVVVFARFRADLDAIKEVAAKMGRTAAELSGRVNELADWQAGSATILAVQIQSGGVGIDLTRAHYCVYYSLGFSLGNYEQSLARVHRPGQEQPVTYFHLVAKGTIDKVVYEALNNRKDAIQAVLDWNGE